MGLLSTFGAATARAYGFTRSAIAQAVDAYFNRVTLLLPGNGTNGAQNNTFLDSSTNNFTITRNGNTTQGTFSPFSQTGWSNYFDGSGDYLSVADNAAFQLGSGDFTIEFWLYLPSGWSSGNSWLIGKGDATTASSSAFSFFRTSFDFYSSSSSYSLTPPSWAANQWYHCAVVRSGTGTNNLKLYIDGAVQSQVSISTNSVNTGSTNPLKIGEYSSDSPESYISNFRIVKGTAVYTSAFTPPTAALTAISGTSILTCQSNRFVDNSSNAFAITVNGTPSVQAFSPFAPTAAYSAATNGGSGYFDGTGDTLSTQATGQFAPAGDFTIGIWFYPTSLAATVHLIGNYTANATTDWLIEVLSTGTIQVFLNGSTLRLSGSGVTVNQWQYISITRSGTTVTGQLNGTNLNSTATYTLSGTFGIATKAIHIGMRGGSGGTNPFTGYIGDIRLVDGQAVTTVPTAPMTQSSQGVTASNTKLLLNFTNAGITDATAKNDLETVGSAQISTAVSKFGGGSMSFNGTNSYLNSAPSQNIAFGTNDFTVEFWFYPSSVSANQGMYDTRTPDTQNAGMGIYITSGAKINWGTQAADYVVGTTTLTINTWYHVACVRSGTSMRMYLNGVQEGSTFTAGSAQNFVNTTARVGFGANGYYNGYIDDLRITKGYARYTANFTPPTAAFQLS